MMLLVPGARLGPYEILALAGRGGMGEVYRARDTRLGRRVAIKVIGAALGSDADVRRRFSEEAQLAANLDHPGICRVYDVGEDGGICYFVMELLEGESLAARLAKGPLPIGELLGCAIEIASALAYAHRRYVVHRDIKPGNVFLTASGVKVLDFGLATLRQLEPASVTDIATVQTVRLPNTQCGVVHGTPEYVAPERLEGRDADARSDIFAFGTVLYEMATGRRAFQAPTPATLIAAIMSSDPPPVTGQGTATRELDWVIRRCLEKDPDARWQSMSDVEAVLKLIASGVHPEADVSRTPHTAGARRSRTAIPRWTAAAVLVCLALGVPVRSWMSRPSLTPASVVRFTVPVEPVPMPGFGVGLRSRVAVSRDGRRMAYVSGRVGPERVYVRDMSSFAAIPLAETDGVTSVFFSPDGEQVGFFAAGKLKKVPVSGGAVATLCDAPEGAGAAWGDDNTIIFAPSRTSALARVPAAGGTPRPITVLQDGETSHRWPDFLPGGNAIVYAAARGVEFTSPRIFVQSLETNARTELTEGTYPRYAPSGHIVFARDDALFVMPFDLARLQPRGAPEAVSDLRMSATTGAAAFALSSNGTLVYSGADHQSAAHELVWVGLDGTEDVVPLDPRPLDQPRLSRDGERVLISVGEKVQDRDVWAYDFVHRTLARLTFERGEEESAVWSPEGSRIAFSAVRSDNARMISTAPSDGGRATQLWSPRYAAHVGDWSPDGRALAWTEFNSTSGGEIRAMALDGSGAVRTLVGGPFGAHDPIFSPDARWLAYTSNETGRDEVYIQSYPSGRNRWQISTGGGTEPVWSRDGKHVFYRGNAHLNAVDVRTTPTFAVGAPRRLFFDTYETGHRHDRNYDVSADGRRFLMVKIARRTRPAELNVILNWAATLGRHDR